MESLGPKKLKLGFIGASGAIGRELIRIARQDPRIEEMTFYLKLK
jgi:aspartate-semialdehyde dehydrogenase